MPHRECLIAGCTRPTIEGRSRCGTHGPTSPRGPSGYDAAHQQLAAAAVANATHCAECGRPLTQPGPHATGTYDPPQGGHIIPRSAGGQNVPGNYQAEHRSCNISKGGTNRKTPRGVKNAQQ